MTPDALSSAGLAFAFIAVALVVVVLAQLWSERRAARAARRPAKRHALSRRAFLTLGTAASVLSLLTFVSLVRRPRVPGEPTPPSAPSAMGIRPSRPSAMGIWISPDELAALPTDVPAFGRLRASSRVQLRPVDVSDQDSAGPQHIMATALVAARLDDDRLRADVRDAVVALVGTEDGSTNGHPERNRPLGIGRNLPGYIIAGDLIHLGRFDPRADARFRSWIDALRTKRVKDADASLVESEPRDHSNWGAYIAAAMTAINLYLDDRSATRASAEMLRGWLGDRDGRQDWIYDTERHDYSWQCHYPDVARYLPVNPAGCVREGLALDGVIPIDMQRGAGFQIPPEHTRYPRESLNGRTVQAELLHRAGFDSFVWGDAGLQRIAERLLALADEFDDAWYEPDIGCYWIIAPRTGARLPLQAPTLGRSVSGIDWILG